MRALRMKWLSYVLSLGCLGVVTSCKTSRSSSDLFASLSLTDFKNYSGSIVCRPGTVAVPESLEEIQEFVRQAADKRLNLRVVSLPAPRSYSPVICPEEGGAMLNLQKFNRVLSLDKEAKTAIIQPGVLISDLNEILNKDGFTFPVMPDYNGISVAGGMATGAHHSSLRIPSAIGDWIEEMKIVDGRGELRTLKGQELDTARVHLGLLGVIYELKIRVLPQYKLRYKFEKIADNKIEQDIERLVREHDYARVMWFPSQKTFILDSFDKVDTATPGDSFNNLWSATPNISFLGDVPVGTLNSSQVLQCTAEFARVKTFAGPFKVVGSDSKSPVGFAHRMIAGTCEPGKCSWDYGIKTRTVEVGFHLRRLPEWIGDIKQLTSQKKACFPILGLYLRFSLASQSAIGQAAGEDTVMFEIHIPQTSSPSLEPSSDVYDEIVQLTLGKYQGRPHWGKNSQPYFAGLGPKQFPNWEAFESLRSEIDPTGVFVSPFWRKISENQRISGEASCAVNKSCICSRDTDCGKGSRCVPGVFYPEARVCKP